MIQMHLLPAKWVYIHGRCNVVFIQTGLKCIKLTSQAYLKYAYSHPIIESIIRNDTVGTMLAEAVPVPPLIDIDWLHCKHVQIG